MQQKTIKLDANKATLIAAAIGRNKKIHHMVDSLMDSLPAIENPDQMKLLYNHLFISEGSLRAELYARKALRLLMVGRLDSSIIETGWPHIKRFLNTHSSGPIDFKKFMNYFIKKSGGINKLSDDDLNDIAILFIFIVNVLERDIINTEVIDNLIIERSKFAFRVNKFGSPIALKSFKDEEQFALKSSIKRIKNLVGFNDNIKFYNGFDMNKDALGRTISYKLFEIENLCHVSILNDLPFQEKDIEETLLSFVLSTSKKELDNILDNSSKDFSLLLRDYFITALNLKWMLRAYKQAKEDFFDLDPVERSINVKKAKEELNKATEERYIALQNSHKIEAENFELRRTIKKLEAELSEKKKEQEELFGLRELFFSLVDEKNEFTEISEDDNQYEDNIHKLKALKAVFVGGHQNFTNKLKEILPDLYFINSENFDTSILEKIDVVFIYSGYCSHALYYKVVDNVNRKKIKYLNNINIKKVVQEMI